MMRKPYIILALAIVSASALTSCKEYYDDVENIGKRVVVLEDSTLAVQNINTRDLLIRLTEAVRTYGIVKEIVKNADGTTSLVFTDDRDPITFVNGKDGEDGSDGKDASVLLKPVLDTDGNYYWAYDGWWLRDEDGNKVPATPTDGKDGKNGEDGVDGKDGKDAEPTSGNIILPMMRINEITRTWEISLDGGLNWRNTGKPADGKDGKDGKDGDDGKNGSDGVDGTSDEVVISASYTDTEVLLEVYINGRKTIIVLPRV